jgi:hypothetical protein
MPRKQQVLDDDSQPVMVPRNDKPLVPVAPERVQRLREHLVGIPQDLRKARHLNRFASPLRTPPTASMRWSVGPLFALPGPLLPER